VASPHDSEQFDVFLSYNSLDYEWVRAAKNALSQRGVSSFLDKDNLRKGLPWPKALEDTLQRVHAVAVFIGPHGIGNWQMREMWFALDIQIKRGSDGNDFPVVPVILPDSDPPAGFLLLNSWVSLKGASVDEEAWEALAGAVLGLHPREEQEHEIEICPYRELRTFREVDAPFFFGRELLSQRLFDKISNNKLVAVIGPSGSGKSSVVMAGLLPLLRRQRPPMPTWDVLIFTPGKQPFHRLAAAIIQLEGTSKSFVDQLKESKRLGDLMEKGEILIESTVARLADRYDGADRILIVIDQFEELFTMNSTEVGQHFVRALMEASNLQKSVLVLTLRADFYGRAIALNRQFSDKLEQGLLNVGQMTEDELYRAVVEPARRVRLEFEPGLAQQLQEEVGTEPGNLALLEFALAQLWERRRGKILTHHAYNEIGKIEGAIAKRASKVLSGFSEDEMRTVREIFTRLVRLGRPDEGTEDTRQRADVKEFGPDAQTVIRTLADARLIVTGRDTATGEEIVEVTHEALIKRWEELRKWLNEDREFLLWRQRLRSDVLQWEQSGHDKGALLRGGLLTEAESWMDRYSSRLNYREHSFIAASLKAARVKGWTARLSVVTGIVLLSLTVFWLSRQLKQERMLSDLQRLEVLEGEANRLWPPDSKHVSELEIWLRSARALAENMQRYEDELRSFQASSNAARLDDLKKSKNSIDLRLAQAASDAPGEDLRKELVKVNEEILPLQRKLDTLTRLVSGLSKLQDKDPKIGAIASIENRLQFAITIRKHSIEDSQDLWEAAISSIANQAECPLYKGLQIKPQEGLIPLQRNQTSTLWEFWHVQSGERPQIKPDGSLQLTPESGLVFVLIPPGAFRMGAVRPDPPNKPILGPNEDPMAREDESDHGRISEVIIAKPFFMSKYEMTQGQYERIVLTNPSYYAPGSDKRVTLLNPVEQVDWYDSEKASAMLGLHLPTEAEWEYAARAMTTTVWWTGNDVHTLQGAVNLSDSRHVAAGHPGDSESWLDDGYEQHAPVGSFRPNGFGLHDIVGNVWEWCFDIYAPYYQSVNANPNDDTIDRTGKLGIIRGGSWASSATFSRSAFRDPYKQGFRYYALGFRPARDVE
jgi:formylglycine-generating enzyme required for sulfatase activity/energy-coupling factor transporter ATP-binding protein EcfA2/type II secretory pathway component PulM